MSSLGLLMHFTLCFCKTKDVTAAWFWALTGPLDKSGFPLNGRAKRECLAIRPVFSMLEDVRQHYQGERFTHVSPTWSSGLQEVSPKHPWPK